MFHNIVYPLLLFCWYSTGNYLYYNNNVRNFKLTKMHVSGIHALSVVISYLIGLPGNLLYYWSVTYYMMDTAYEFVELYNKTNLKLFNLGMMAHHFVTIGVMGYLEHHHGGKQLYYGFFLSELSNLPMYVMYHLRAIKYNNWYVLKLIVVIEALAFIICRLILGGILSFDLFVTSHVPAFVRFASFLILIISVIWTKKLVKQIYYT